MYLMKANKAHFMKDSVMSPCGPEVMEVNDKQWRAVIITDVTVLGFHSNLSLSLFCPTSVLHNGLSFTGRDKNSVFYANL